MYNSTKLIKLNENLLNKNENEVDKKKENGKIPIQENIIDVKEVQYKSNNKNKNITIPILTEYYLKNLGYEENKLYNEIISFLKSEYKKVENINKYGTITTYTNLKLNILILDKIKLYTEDTFNFIQKNILSRKNKNYIKEKLELLVEHILDYKKNFLIDENKINKSFNNIFYSKNNNNYDNKQIVKKSNKNEKQSIIFSSERISENENKEIENKINNNLNNNKNTINKINENEYYNFSKVKSNKIPSLKDYILNNLDDIEKSLYNEIIIFLNNEYSKVENIKKYGTITPYINLKLNILILDKIRLYTEDTFNYIHQNFSNWKFRMFFKEKLELLIINISDYKKNFLIDETKINNSNNKINHSYSTNSYFNKPKYNFISKYSI
jgi:hypothetical protein